MVMAFRGAEDRKQRAEPVFEVRLPVPLSLLGRQGAPQEGPAPQAQWGQLSGCGPSEQDNSCYEDLFIDVVKSGNSGLQYTTMVVNFCGDLFC